MNNWLNIDFFLPSPHRELQISPRLSGLRFWKKVPMSVFFPIIIVSGLIVFSTWVSTACFSTRLLKRHQRTRLLRWGFAPCVIKRVREEFRDSSELGLDDTLCGGGHEIQIVARWCHQKSARQLQSSVGHTPWTGYYQSEIYVHVLLHKLAW